MPANNESDYREPTVDECMVPGFQFEIYTHKGWVEGTYPTVFDANRGLDEFKDDAEQKCAHAMRRVRKQFFSYPEEFTPELDEILGWSMIDCCQRANLFRQAGIEIPKKAEREVAYMKHWMLKFYFKHGADWRKYAVEEFNRIVEPLRKKLRDERDAKAAETPVSDFIFDGTGI